MTRGSTALPARGGLPVGGPAVPVRQGWARRVLGALGDSCALAGAALLGCLALVAVGAAGSLVWAYVVER